MRDSVVSLRNALIAYAVLALLAGITLDGLWRAVVWVFLAALAVKSWILVKRRSREEK